MSLRWDESKGYGGHEADVCCKMIPLEFLAIEHEHGDYSEHGQSNSLLNYLELEEGERAACAAVAHTVGRNHKTIFQERQAPGEEDDGYQRPVFDHAGLREFEIAIPGECHKDIGYY